MNLKSTVIALGLSSLSAMACAELKTPRAVVNNDGTERLIATINFSTPVVGDLYVATEVAGQLLFLVNGGREFIYDVAPLAVNQTHIGQTQLFDFSTAGIASGQYPLYQVVTESGTDPLDVANWVGGFSGLSVIHFNIGLPVEISGDLDQDGFADDDLNHDSFHDDDLDRDGFHDDDLDYDGFHDGDLDQNGVDDEFESEQNSGDTGSGEEPEEGDDDDDDDDLYNTHCSGCHGFHPEQNINRILRASNPANILRAINANSGGMRFLSYLSDSDLEAIANYVRNP